MDPMVSECDMTNLLGSSGVRAARAFVLLDSCNAPLHIFDMGEPSWDDLRIASFVQRAGSVSEAARVLGVDKATVSRAVTKLEEALGTRVFDRTPRGPVVTPEGARVLETATRMETSVRDLEDTLRGGELRGSVFLTLPEWFACSVLAGELPAFAAQHPRITLHLVTSNAVLNVAQRDAEIAIRNVRPDQMSVSARKAGKLGSALYGARTYLRTRGTPGSRGDMEGHDLCAYDRAVTFASELRWLNQTGARITVRTQGTQALASAIVAGVGLGVLPCILGDAQRELVRVPFAGVSADDIWLVTPSDARKLARVRAVMDLMVATWKKNDRALEGRAEEKPGKRGL
jgi:DNA-binding transcriptional LysR family regulator